MNLAEYERRKFELADILRAAVVHAPKRVSGPDAGQELFARLAEDRFNLVVVGRFSRGKSSLMNAIMGLDRLPTDIVPLTSVITSVSYGSEESVEISFEGRSLTNRVGIDELHRYVTQAANPGNELRVEMAEVQLPSEILRRGFYFIDTPGLGSPTLENTRTTEAFLPSADAFLLVTSFDGPLSDDELRLLEAALPTRRRIFVAVNKQDTIPADDRERVLDYVRGQLAMRAGSDPPQVFSTSAIEGLSAKLSGDAAAIASSGLAVLEEALLGFLIEHKSQQFLSNMCDRLETFVAALPKRSSADLEALSVRLAELRGHLGGVIHDRALPAAIGGLAPAHSEEAGACEVCREMEAAAFEFLSHHQYELTISEAQQDRLAEMGGLCALHTWSYYALASPLGVSIGYPRLMERWRDELVQLSADDAHSDPAATVVGHLPAHGTCPVCRACDEAETLALSGAADGLASSERELDRLSGLCLRHLSGLLRLLDKPSARQALLRREAGLFERVAEDMRRYALKREGLRRGLASHAEDQAGARALRLLAGLRNLSFANRPE